MSQTSFDPTATATVPATWSAADSCANVIVRIIPAVLIAVLSWFLFGLALTAAGLTGIAGKLLAAVMAIALLVLLFWLLSRHTRRQLRTTSFIVDGAGLTFREPHATRRIAWADLVGVGPVAILPSIDTSSSLVRKGTVDKSDQLPYNSPVGLFGRGVVAVDVDADGLCQQQYAAAQATWGTDPGTGEALVAINPSRATPSGRWDQTVIGQYLQHHRPDLWPAAQAQLGAAEAVPDEFVDPPKEQQ